MKLEKQGVVALNTLLELPTISNFVIINKETSRILKAYKANFKQKQKGLPPDPSDKPPTYRLMLDSIIVNTIPLENRNILLHKPTGCRIVI